MQPKIAKSTLTFIADLQKNNDRDWFGIHKNRFEEARADFISFLDTLLVSAAAIEPVAATQQGKELLFRIYRDVRFSKNKNPYKDHFGAYLAEGGRKSINPGYYVHLSPGNQSFIACGMWQPPAEPLKAIRQEIDYNLAEFEKIIQNPEFKKIFGEVEGERLKTTPKGYTIDNPAIEYLKFKGWHVVHRLPDTIITSDKLFPECLEVIRLAKPFKEFLMRPLREMSFSAS